MSAVRRSVMAPAPTRRGSYETEYPADRHVALLLLSLGEGPPPPETGRARISGRRAWLWATRDPWHAAWGLLHLRCESAQPNKGLKLAAPGSQGRIPFVIDHLERRSLSEPLGSTLFTHPYVPALRRSRAP